MKKAKFLVSHFDASIEKFKAGEAYPLDDETRLCIARGAAEEVEVDDEDSHGPTRADLEELLRSLGLAIVAGTAPGSADSALNELRGGFGDMVTAEDEALVRDTYKAAKDDAEEKEKAEAEAKAAAEAAEKAAADAGAAPAAAKSEEPAAVPAAAGRKRQ